MSRIAAWYRRGLPFSRTSAVLSVVLVMVALLLTAMVTWGNDSFAVVFAFGIAFGFGSAGAVYLAWAIRAWREQGKSRRTQ